MQQFLQKYYVMTAVTKPIMQSQTKLEVLSVAGKI